MNIMEKNKIYKTLKIITDILITYSIARLVLLFVLIIIQYNIKGDLHTVFDNFSGAIVNISRVILLPIDTCIFIVILFQLRKIFISISANIPFEMKNIVRVRSIGYALLMLGVLNSLDFYIFLLFNAKSRNLGINSSKHIVNFFQFIFAGFIILVIAEVFRVGAEMYDEHKLTV